MLAKMRNAEGDLPEQIAVYRSGLTADEGEDIETLEVSIEEALAMVDDGRIIDGKTIMLVQYAALRIF